MGQTNLSCLMNSTLNSTAHLGRDEQVKNTTGELLASNSTNEVVDGQLVNRTGELRSLEPGMNATWAQNQTKFSRFVNSSMNSTGHLGRDEPVRDVTVELLASNSKDEFVHGEPLNRTGE